MDALPHQDNPQQQQKKSKGRRKIKIEKIKSEFNLQVTFSKRRAGLFKKASELDTLCGCKSAVVAFSPSQKAYSYGNPDVETIAGMFWNHVKGRNQRIEGFNHGHNDPIMRQFNLSLTESETQLEVEKRQNKELKKKSQENQGKPGGIPNLDELNYQQLVELKKSVLNFKKNLETKVQNHVDQSCIDGDIVDQSWIDGGIGLPLGMSSNMGDHYGSNYNPTTYINDSHVPIPKNYPVDPFFSEMTTTIIGCLDPYGPPTNDNLGLPFQYPRVAGGSNPIDPQTMNTNAGAENTSFPSGFAEDSTQEFPIN